MLLVVVKRRVRHRGGIGRASAEILHCVVRVVAPGGNQLMRRHLERDFELELECGVEGEDERRSVTTLRTRSSLMFEETRPRSVMSMVLRTSFWARQIVKRGSRCLRSRTVS